jgi:hypothetical protein
MFPADTITKSHELNGPSSFTFETGTNVKYILQMAIQQSGQASDTVLYCGTTMVARNYAKDTPNILMNRRCENTISTTKTGNDSSVVTVSYVNRDVTLQSPFNALTVSDFATGSAMMNGVGTTFHIFFIFFLFAIFYMFFNIGKEIYRR